MEKSRFYKETSIRIVNKRLSNYRLTSKLIQPSEVNRFQLGYKGTKVVSRAVPFIIRSRKLAPRYLRG